MRGDGYMFSEYRNVYTEKSNLTLYTPKYIPSAICWHYYELTIFSTLAG